MSFAELKEQVAALSPRKRLQLAAFLAEMQNRNEMEFRAEINRRMKAMDAGQKISSTQVEKQHRKLLAQGR